MRQQTQDHIHTNVYEHIHNVKITECLKLFEPKLKMHIILIS